MSSILLYVPTEGEDGLRRLQLAADFVEALTFRLEGGGNLSPRRIGIVAEPSVCLEIALSMLGRGEARTVEGGERQVSPLVLFPYRNEDGYESILLGGESRDEVVSGTLDDLVTLGAVEPERGERFGESGWRDRETALIRALEWEDFRYVVSFSSLDSVPAEIRNSGLRWIQAGPRGGEYEQVARLLDSLEPVGDELLGGERKAAVEAAVALGTLLAIWRNLDDVRTA